MKNKILIAINVVKENYLISEKNNEELDKLYAKLKAIQEGSEVFCETKVLSRDDYEEIVNTIIAILESAL